MSSSGIAAKTVGRAFGIAQKLYWQYIYGEYRSKFDIHPDFVFHGYNISIFGTGRMVLGARSYIGQNSRLVCGPDGADLVIGEDCAIATNARISPDEKTPDRLSRKRGAITIGDRVRIGVNCYIGPGVTIGDDAVVGANSVVVDDVPAGAIVGGVPAKFIRMK